MGHAARNRRPESELEHYDDAAHTIVETDPRGFRRTTQLDGFDRVHQVFQETGDEILETTSFHDANGNLKSSLDAEGRETEFVYDEGSRLVEVHHPLSLTSRFSYDGEGNKIEEVNRRGLASRFAYDNLGRLLSKEIDQPITGGGALIISEVTYLDNERKRVERDARNNATTFEMDSRGRVTKVTDPNGFFQTFEYDGVDKIAEVDKKGRRTQFEYDGIHRLTKVTDAPLQTISTTYVDAARQVVETHKRGIEKRTQLDALGRLLSVTRSSVVLERHEYDGNSNRVLSTDANGNRTQFVYDGANRLTARTDALATTTRFNYDRVGNLLEEKDGRATGKTFDVSNTYDELNRLETSADGEGNVTTYEYDPDGNRTAVIEPKGLAHRTEYDYGELNELLEVRMPDGGVYSYRYDPTRNRIFQQDGEGNVVTFTYDRLNRVDLMVQDPGGFNLTTNHDYDANGNEIQLTDPKGQVITFDYDELNRLKFKQYNLTPADLALFTRTHRIDYVYNPNDDVERIDETKSSGTDPPAVVSSFKTYDDLDRLETETDAWGKGLTYDYDPAGNRIFLIDPDGKRTVYAYDELNRLETLTLDDQQAVNYEYFPDVLKKTVTNPNGTTSTYLYDAADRMTDITHVGPTGVISAYEYTYNPNSNRERQVETNAGRTETTDYTYDFVNRLKTVTYPERGARYEYDLSGNRIQEVTTGAEASDETLHYDAINRLERITDTASGTELTRYSYDANGNTTSKTKAGVTTNFLFDIRDQLGEVRQGASILGRYGYDYDGRRILKIGDDGRRQYTYDQLSVITEADQVNNTVSKYDYGMDQLVRLDNRSEGRSFFHLDGIRSTVSLTGAAGATRQSIFFDAWGNERDRIGSSANNFTFTGHELDEETGLIYAKARFYDSEIGRFLTQDPLEGQIDSPPSLHRYYYVRSNPLVLIDPSGLLEFHYQDIQSLKEEMNNFEGVLGGDLRQGKVRRLHPNPNLGEILEPPGDALVNLIEKFGDVGKATQALDSLLAGGMQFFAYVVLEPEDFNEGVLNQEKVLKEFRTEVGGFAFGYSGSENRVQKALNIGAAVAGASSSGNWFELFDVMGVPGLEDDFLSEIENAKTGDRVDISDVFSIGFQDSLRKSLNIAGLLPRAGAFAASPEAERSDRAVFEYLFGFIAEDVALAGLGLHGLAPRQVQNEAGLRVAVQVVMALLFEAGFREPSPPGGKIHGHHSDPKFLGGDPKQPLTDLPDVDHRALHRDLDSHLRNKTDEFSNDMRPRRGNPGTRIRENFSRQDRLEALAEFYNGSGSKYQRAARDFFKQHPGLRKN